VGGAMIRNPILPGFNPDPSICRVGADYYIATSTFEWYPGVQIHHSRDLVNWRLVKRPLDRAAQLDMRGNPDSCGVWAPCLSHADGLFWLVYTDVKRYSGNFKDTHNYIVTAPAIEGPWSDPVYVNSSGFDPSLFHDDNGRKWFLNMLWNHRSDAVGGQPRIPGFAGILLQEWDPKRRCLVGEARNVFRGSALGLVEGPHLHKRKGWYYLTVAEGGTSYVHAVTMARSRHIDGPYTRWCIRSRRRMRPMRRCSAPATARSSRRPMARSITRTCARGRCAAICGARHWGARRRSRSASGATTTGSTSSTVASCPRSTCRRPIRP
jgi:xylan 1,4-beta-xylosidase